MSVRTEMAPPVQRPVRRKEEPERGLPRPSRMVVNQAVLAERNPGRVAAVGAWIEPGDRGAADCVRVPAQQIEDQLIQYQREKEQRLIRFQGEVKRRVNQHAKQCKQHQLQKSYDVITREGIIVTQSSDAAMHFTPKRNTCTYRNTEVAICSPHKRWVSAQRISDDSEDDLKEWDGNKLFSEHAKALKNTMRQVRGRLAALKTVEAEELTLPGGLWKVSPTRDNPVSRRSPVLCSSIAEEDEISLRGYHDLPVELLPHESQRHLLEKENAIPSVKSVCNRLMKESYRAGPAPAYNTDYRAALVLRPGVDEEEERKQRQSQYLMYRRLFMDIEREQVKETRRQKEHERKISKMKHEREVERLMEEQRLRVSAFPHIQRRSSESEETKQEATAEVERERVQKSKDCNRYIEALRAQMKDKLLFHNIELPPLCCCGSDFWDSHPDTCANNCVFYKNPKAYSRALQSVLLSRDMWDGSAGSRFSACNISFAEPRASPAPSLLLPFRYRGSIIVLTFLFYTSYHLSRKPISVVKSQLHRNCSEIPNPPANISENDTTWCSWAPFDQSNYKELLGSLDTSFLVAYAIGMFISGIFGERLPLRYYLSGGMVISGVFTAFMGLGYYWNIHALWYYILFQILNGLAQTTGWPSVVACMGNWFGKGKRGFIMGIWNSHTAVGNILGSLIAGAFVSTAWGLSFIVPGIIIGSFGVICFFFLIEYPEDVGCTPPDQTEGANGELENDQGMNSSTENIYKSQAADLEESAGPQEPVEHPRPISFWGALRIPGVVEFSLCLLFSKLVSYTFLYWLPLYISNVAHFDPKKAGDMSTLFDAGGILGGILAGAISDYTGGQAITCSIMLILTAPMLFIYNQFGQTDVSTTVAMLIICGVLVNGPYSLITTAVSADLGTHESLHGNAKALATVTAIIDGSGSIGAALGPTLASVLSSKGWNYVFYMLIAADLLACLFLARLVYKEIKKLCPCFRKTQGYREM